MCFSDILRQKKAFTIGQNLFDLIKSLPDRMYRDSAEVAISLGELKSGKEARTAKQVEEIDKPSVGLKLQRKFVRGRKFFYVEADENQSSSYRSCSIWTFRDEEEVRKRYWYDYISEGDIVFDIGSSFGSYLLPALALGSAYVFGFCPQKEYDDLLRNLSANKGFSEKCFLSKFGLYSKEGYLDIYSQEYQQNLFKGSVMPSIFGDSIIPVITLDSFIQNL